MADPTSATTRVLTYSDAILEAIVESMEVDPNVLVMGVGVDDPLPTRNAMGLVERFGKNRVIGTPLSEDGMAGVAIGLAMGGFRPLQIHGRIDFALLSMNQLVNVAAKIRGMYGGAVGGVPMVVKGTIGRSWGQGGQHSQGLQSLFAHIPGLRVAMPTTAADAKTVMAWALTKSADPLVFIDHRMLHKLVGEVPAPGLLDLGAIGTVNGRWHTNDRFLSETRADVTIVAVSYMVVEALRAMAHLGKLGIKAEVCDPVWIRPLTAIETIASAAKQSGKLLVVDCGWPSFGVSAEIVAGVAERSEGKAVAFARMGFAETVCPTAKSLEALYYPNAETIARKAFAMVTGEEMPVWDAAAAPEVAAFRGPF